MKNAKKESRTLRFITIVCRFVRVRHAMPHVTLLMNMIVQVYVFLQFMQKSITITGIPTLNSIHSQHFF